MATTYNLAPIPRWIFNDIAAKPLSGGYIKSFRDLDHSQFKPIYQDINGAFPYADPVLFDLSGMAPGIFYFASDEYYYLEIYDANNVLQFTVPHYNAPGFGTPTPPVPTDPFPNNLARNPQFSLWSTSLTWPGYGTSLNNLYDYVSDDWVFQRSNLNATININAIAFTAGQTDVPFNPIYAFEYECTNAGAGAETFKLLGQRYDSVQTLSGQTVTISFWARTKASGSLNVQFFQFFAGGSTDVTTLAGTIASLSTTWTFYSFTLVIPSINGKIIGTAGIDCLLLEFGMPLNQPATVQIANVYLQRGPSASPFPYVTFDDDEHRTEYNVTQSLWYTGDVKPTFRAVADLGWLLLGASSTIGNQSSGATYAGGYTKALYKLLWANVANAFCPVSGGRGVSSEADFNANKTLTLPQTQNRVMAQTDNGTHPLGSTAGAATTVLSTAQMPAHQHGTQIPVNSGLISASGGSYGVYVSGSGLTSIVGTNAPVDILQPTVYVNYQIKL